METTKQKGDALEKAVSVIEEVILQQAPELKEERFRIIGNKIIVVNDVPFEYDIWVEVNLASKGKHLTVFECKNWDTKKVTPCDVIYFAEKMKAAGANMGIFVATNFTRYARLQAKNYKNMILLDVTRKDSGKFVAPLSARYCYVHINDPGIHLCAKVKSLDMDSLRRHPEKFDWKLNGNPIDLNDQKKIVKKEFANKYFAKHRGDVEDGHYQYDEVIENAYPPGKVTVNGCNVGGTKLEFEVYVEVFSAVAVSEFSVQDRGRFVSFEPHTTKQGQKIEFQYVEPGASP